MFDLNKIEAEVHLQDQDRALANDPTVDHTEVVEEAEAEAKMTKSDPERVLRPRHPHLHLLALRPALRVRQTDESQSQDRDLQDQVAKIGPTEPNASRILDMLSIHIDIYMQRNDIL